MTICTDFEDQCVEIKTSEFPFLSILARFNKQQYQVYAFEHYAFVPYYAPPQCSIFPTKMLGSPPKMLNNAHHREAFFIF